MKNILNTFKFLFILTMLGACSDDYLDVNTDPNNPLSVSPDLLLPVALNYAAIIEDRDRGQNHLGNMFMANWSQSDGFSWYTDEFAYRVTTTFYSRIFDYNYGTVLKQFNVLRQLEGEQYGNYKAIAAIMSALHFQIIVDTYGDVPYSEALQRGGNPTPKYDDAQTIYNALVNDLTDAIALIKATKEVAGALVPGDDDGVFAGDMDSWIQFANNVKLRLLVRQSSMTGNEAYLTEEFGKISTEGSGFYTDDVIINIGYNNAEDQQNRKWADFGQDVSGSNTLTNDATCATPYILNRLTSTNDPRIDALFEEPDTGHLGVVQGLLDYDVPTVDQFVPDNVSNIGPGILTGPDQGTVLYSSAETHFNLAEAAHKGYVTGTPKTYYEGGISASFDYLDVSGAATYYAQNIANVGWDASSDKLEAIMVQKATALIGINAIQSWFDYNRTGFPDDVPLSLTGNTKPNIPTRLAYPSSEVTSNTVNLPSQPDVFTTKIFWAN